MSEGSSPRRGLRRRRSPGRPWGDARPLVQRRTGLASLLSWLILYNRFFAAAHFVENDVFQTNALGFSFQVASPA